MDELDRWLRGHDQGLDGVAMASGQLLNELSRAQMTAADNLVAKAFRAAEQGDETRRQRFLERACRLAYDEREEAHPGPWAAHMALHTEVVDALEETQDADDSDWLDVALLVLPQVTGVGREHLADILWGLVAQEDFYELSASETTRIRRAVGERSLESDFGLEVEASVEQQVVVARSLLDAALAYHLAYVHLGD